MNRRILFGAVGVVLAVALVLFVLARDNAFLLSESMGGSARERNCVGFVTEIEQRGGVEFHCIGIPWGTWRCTDLIPDQKPVPIDCGDTGWAEPH